MTISVLNVTAGIRVWNRAMVGRCHSLKSDITPGAFHCRLIVLQTSSLCCNLQ